MSMCNAPEACDARCPSRTATHCLNHFKAFMGYHRLQGTGAGSLQYPCPFSRAPARDGAFGACGRPRGVAGPWLQTARPGSRVQHFRNVAERESESASAANESQAGDGLVGEAPIAAIGAAIRLYQSDSKVVPNGVGGDTCHAREFTELHRLLAVSCMPGNRTNL